MCPTFTLTATGDVITSDVITKQWQVQCVDINSTIFRVKSERKYIALHMSISLHFTLTLLEENVV